MHLIMNRRRLSLPTFEPNQPGISQFVEREKEKEKEKEKRQIQFISAKSKTRPSTPSSIRSPSVNRASKKRTRPVLSSPDSSTEKQPNKKQVKNMESENQVNHGDEGEEKLTPDLELLKKQLFAGFQSMIEPLKKDIQQLQNDRSNDESTLCVETVNRKFMRNEAKQKKIEDRLSLIEDQLLEKNLIFQGLHETEYENNHDIKGQVIRAISNTMPGEDLDEKRTNAGCTSIDQVERVGRFNPLRSRPVKVKFTDKSDVDHLLKNKRKLPQGIYVEREYSKATEKERRLLRPVIKAARKMTKYHKKCRMEGPHVVLDGTHYHRENIHTLPPELAADKVTSRTNQEILAFFGELHPLSNFHTWKFEYEGESFHSSEQLIQLKKAEFFGDNIARERILNSTDAQDSKEIAMDIVNYSRDRWNAAAEELCYDGIREKFVQNPILYSYLLDTGNKTIVEATYDNVWGTGKPLGDENCLNPSEWTNGVGILGKILMRIRDSTYEGSTDNEETDGVQPMAITAEPADYQTAPSIDTNPPD